MCVDLVCSTVDRVKIGVKNISTIQNQIKGIKGIIKGFNKELNSVRELKKNSRK